MKEWEMTKAFFAWIFFHFFFYGPLRFFDSKEEFSLYQDLNFNKNVIYASNLRTITMKLGQVNWILMHIQ